MTEPVVRPRGVWALTGIQIPEGRRPLDEKAVVALADSIADRGLLQPPGIRPDGRLVWGRHRVAALARLGESEVECAIVEGDDLDCEMAEIDENLMHVPLTAAQRTTQLARRKEIYEQKHPETKWGGDRKSEAHRKSNVQSEHLIGFVRDTAAKTGKGVGTIARDVRIGQAFTAEEIGRMEKGKIPLLTMDRLVALRGKDPGWVEALLEKNAAQMRDLCAERGLIEVRKRTPQDLHRCESAGACSRDRRILQWPPQGL